MRLITLLSKMLNWTKFLGVIIDEKLTWIPHTDYLAKKISKSIGILMRLKGYLTSDSLVNMYYAFIYPYYHYCNEVWGNAYTTHVRRLYVLQKRAIRIIAKVEPLAHSSALFSKLKILTVPSISLQLTAQFMFRMHRHQLPSLFDDMFIRNVDVHHYNTRQSKDFHVPLVRTNTTKMTISYKGVIIWNDINKIVNTNFSLAAFKSNLKKYLLQQQV